MIDVHNHLLPAMDDGAASREETLTMCRMASEDGIEVIIATPHSYDDKFINHPNEIRSLVTDLNEQLTAAGIDLRVLPGMEVRVSAELPNRMENGEILSLNDNGYVLLEFHPAHIPSGFENLVHRLTGFGYRLIIAHPERNIDVQRHPEYLFKLLDVFDPFTILCQLSASSLLDRNGSQSAKTAGILLKNNLAHLIATDAHDSRWRPPVLSRAVRIAAGIVGEEKASKMVRDFPQKVINGEAISDEWQPRNPRRWWRIL